jgi:hypothetical protein
MLPSHLLPNKKMEAIAFFSTAVRTATPHDTVINSECVYTFHTPHTSPEGVVVNLSTFMGTIEELADGICVRIVKRREKKDAVDREGENVTKLGIQIEGGFISLMFWGWIW